MIIMFVIKGKRIGIFVVRQKLFPVFMILFKRLEKVIPWMIQVKMNM